MTVDLGRPRAYALSLHASYRCGHSGACCTSGWAIPVEAPLRVVLERAQASGRLAAPGAARTSDGGLVETLGLPPGCDAVLASDASGCCAFFDRDDRRCAIQRDLGHASLPVACQHFPRVCLIDDRGLFVTLSHYCPTAAAALFDAVGPVTRVESPAVVAPGVVYEGLEVRGELPPLLRPGVLMDLDSYDRWERFMVEELAGERAEPEAALRRLASVADRLRDWQPVDGPLGNAVDCAIESAAVEDHAVLDWAFDPAGTTRLYECVDACVPVELAEPRVEAADFLDLDARWVVRHWPDFSAPVGRYLAARSFANWAAYQGHGLRTVVLNVLTSLAVVRVEAARRCGLARRPLDRDLLVEAVRAADLTLLHHANLEDLNARLTSLAEGPIGPHRVGRGRRRINLAWDGEG